MNAFISSGMPCLVLVAAPPPMCPTRKNVWNHLEIVLADGPMTNDVVVRSMP